VTTRIVSGAVLVVLAVGVVWYAPALLFLLVAELLVVLACHEYATLSRASRLPIPVALSSVAAAVACASFSRAPAASSPWMPLDVMLLTSFVAIGAVSLARWQGGPDSVASVSSSLLPVLYIGLPLGAMVAIRENRGPAALFLLMLTIIVSDSAQYFVGRLLGRRPLAPGVSPKKTIEGAVGGVVFGTALLAIVGAWWLPWVSAAVRIVLGLAVVALGIVGDLFESMLKRSAGVKDSSALIPGHGGVLDRIDALLFAAPVYYVVLRYV
jgi:phosphatidate cytidylyltransferase